MTIETCYQNMGGNYQEVRSRIPSDALIKKFIGAFLTDPSFESLCSSMEAGDRETAFRAAHTLKGVCANLSLSSLQKSASTLTEVLRPESDTIPEAAIPMLEDVKKDYLNTTEAIRSFLAEA